MCLFCKQGLDGHKAARKFLSQLYSFNIESTRTNTRLREASLLLRNSITNWLLCCNSLKRAGNWVNKSGHLGQKYRCASRHSGFSRFLLRAGAMIVFFLFVEVWRTQSLWVSEIFYSLFLLWQEIDFWVLVEMLVVDKPTCRTPWVWVQLLLHIPGFTLRFRFSSPFWEPLSFFKCGLWGSFHILL